MGLFGATTILMSAIGTAYTLVAMRSVAGLARMCPPVAVPPEPVTLLKPLHGAEPRLAENLGSFLVQHWPAPIEMVAGVQRADDPAAEVVRGLGRDISLVVDPRRHGSNAKVGNLLNMAPAATHDLLVLSDSDMAVPATYLPTVAAALGAPGVGAVTCLYRGRGDAGWWSVMGAAAISYGFLPSVLVGLRFGLAKPCMGSTIALRRETLDRVGGFARFADLLADDYAIGAAVRDLGLAVAVPPLVLIHGCAERSFVELVRHELRWAATVRQIDLAGYLGMIATFPVPFALMAAVAWPLPGGIALVAAVLARWRLMVAVDRAVDAPTAPAWLLPLRDMLSLGVYLVSFMVGSVEWRGSRLGMRRDGRIAAGAPR